VWTRPKLRRLHQGKIAYPTALAFSAQSQPLNIVMLKIKD